MSSESYEFREDYEDSEAFGSDEVAEMFDADEDSEANEDTEDSEADEADEDTEDSEVDEADEDSEDSEADEADEDTEVDESYASRRRKAEARRRAERARQNRKNQQTAARRMAAAQQQIQRQTLRAGRAQTQTAPVIRGTGKYRLRGPDNKALFVDIEPKLAVLSDVNKLRATFAANDKRQSLAIARLSSAQAQAMKKIANLATQSDKQLAKRVVDGQNVLDKRITSEITAQKQALNKQQKQFRRALKDVRNRQLMNSVTVASSIPLFAAYGDRSDPFSKNNLILSASLGFWLLSDDLVANFTGTSKKGGLAAGANIFSYLAPVGNVLTGHFLLDEKLHERFIIGKKTVAAGTSFTFSISKEPDKDDKPLILAISLDGKNNSPLTATLDKEKVTVKRADDVALVAGDILFVIDTKPETSS